LIQIDLDLILNSSGISTFFNQGQSAVIAIFELILADLSAPPVPQYQPLDSLPQHGESLLVTSLHSVCKNLPLTLASPLPVVSN
jgi:hypothetical protein